MERIVIIGAGIGGLSAAVALRQRGLRATVYEKAARVRPAGAGIVVPPIAMAVLERWNLSRNVLEAGDRLKSLQIRTAQGRLVQDLNVAKILPEAVHPAVAIARPALHHVLLGALEPDQVHLGHTCTGLEVLADRVRVQFSEGPALEAGAVIAADGLHSVVRRQLLPHAHARYSGQTSFRGIAALEPPADLRSIAWELWGRAIRFGLVPLGAGALYWYATQRAPAGSRCSGDEALARLRDTFRQFHPHVLRALEQTPPESIVQTDIFDHPPGHPWCAGPVALLGDAAHATTPNLGQGGAQAIEDAGVIARCLAETENPSQAFQQYERARMARANEVIALSWRLGKLSEWSNPLACAARNWLLRRTPASTMRRRYRLMLTPDA